jgi:hemoglobin
VTVRQDAEVTERYVPLPDLDDRDHIRRLVLAFYREVATDELLGPVFCQQADVDWSAHIPKLVDYWCRVLLRLPGYEGRLLQPHLRVHRLEAFHPPLFDRWYRLFVDEVDRGWRGPMADSAKEHAARMAGSLARRLLNMEWVPPEA